MNGRQSFENWYVQEEFGGDFQAAEPLLIRDPVSGGYLYRDPAHAWKIWQASRSAVQAELSEIWANRQAERVQ